MNHVIHQSKWLSIIFLVILGSCTQMGDGIESSSLKSFSLDGRLDLYQSGEMDVAQENLYMLTWEQLGFVTAIRKLNLETLEIEKIKLNSSDLAPTGTKSLYCADDNSIIIHLFNRTNGIQLLYRYNSDLQVTDTDTIHAIRGQSASRVKMCQAGPGQFAVAMNIQEASGRWIMRYELRDNSLKVLKTTDDTTGSYQAFLIGLQVTRCSDGGYFYAAARYAPPSFSLDCYFEKRDADFNLLWRAEYGGNTNERPSTIMEFGGNHVSYGIGAHPDDPSKQSLFILWYDNNGKLIKEKFLDGGGVDFKLNEQMVRTEDGGFLATSSTSLGATSNNSKTILYKIDENLEIKEIKLFGSNSGVLHGDILKVDVNKYLLLYGDNGFEGEQGAARYITIYVDQNGGIIKG